MENKFKVSLYIRVSTGRQAREGDSLEEQEHELKKFCEYKNYLIYKTHIERGRTAKNTNRPEYQKLLADIKAKKINAIVIKRIDRFSRSLLDFEEFMRIAQENNVEFISLKENFDTTNAMGKAMLRVALVFAQLEREQISERVSDVMNYRAEQGLYNGGGIPYGYDVINKELVPHRQERKIIELIFNKFLETKSTSAVTKELNTMGIRNRNNLLWDCRHIDKILRKVVYIGKISWAGQIYTGLHQPIISENTFNKVQEIFNDRKNRIFKSSIGGVLKGFIYCGYCNTLLTSNYAKKRNGKKYYYYRCLKTFSPAILKNEKCKSGYYSMKNLENEVFENIIGFSTEKILQNIQSNINANNQTIEKEISLLKDELSNLEMQLDIIKNKKEKYLNSLIEKDFKPNERRAINNKIEEFTLEEKQIKAKIYRQQFDLSNKMDSIQSIDEFKQEILFFKVNYITMNLQELNNWLVKNINKIIYTEEGIKIEFKLLNIGL